jgi:hypothetical protein
MILAPLIRTGRPAANTSVLRVDRTEDFEDAHIIDPS